MSFQIYVMRNKKMDHQSNLQILLELQLHDLSMDRGFRRFMYQTGVRTSYWLVIFLLSNSNTQIKMVMPNGKKLLDQLKLIRRFYANTIEPASGKINTQAKIDYRLLIRILTHHGIHRYLSKGGTIPDNLRSPRIWIAPAKEILVAIEEEILKKESPYEVIYAFVSIINRHLRFVSKDSEPLVRNTFKKHLSRLHAYQMQYGGFIYFNHKQEILKLDWVYEKQKRYLQGDTKSLVETLEYILELLPKLAFPSRKQISKNTGGSTI